VVGVDVEPHPNYPFEFVLGDALKVIDRLAGGGVIVGTNHAWTLGDFDAVHASPPCQDHSETKVLGRGHGTGWLLAATRAKIPALGLPWVIENVQGSSVAEQDDLFGANGLTLCGCMFPELRGLLYEDRLFETSFGIAQPRHVKHLWPQTKMGRPPRAGECMQVTGHFSDVEEARRRMGCPWMTRDELAQAIPPVYTRHIGERLLEHLSERAA